GVRVSARGLQGQGCPVCAGKKVIRGVNDLAATHPHLTAEWADENPFPATQVVAGSNRRFSWVCSVDPRHRWEATLNNRSSGSGGGCPVCAGKKVMRGVNDLATTRPDVAK